MNGIDLARAPLQAAPLLRQSLLPETRPPRGLMLCSLFTLAYRAMRSFTDAGVSVHALGNAASRGMRHSRLCGGFSETGIAFDGSSSAVMIDLVNREIDRQRIDFVFAGDQPATRSLIAMRDQLVVPCFPMPSLATFDLLNDKARFTALCRSLRIPHPPTAVFADRRGLLDAIADGTIELPAVVKPLALDGNRGVVEILTPADVSAMTIEYRPVLVQRFIPGQDIGASIFAEEGRVTAYICHRLRRATYTVLDHPEVLSALASVAAATGATGILNFDMRLSPDGRVWFLECNPRVFFKMPLSTLAGVNFADAGLDMMRGTSNPDIRMPPPGRAVRTPKAILAALPSPSRLGGGDIAMLRHILVDPVPYCREALRLEWEDRSY